MLTTRTTIRETEKGRVKVTKEEMKGLTRRDMGRERFNEIKRRIWRLGCD